METVRKRAAENLRKTAAEMQRMTASSHWGAAAEMQRMQMHTSPRAYEALPSIAHTPRTKTVDGNGLLHVGAKPHAKLASSPRSPRSPRANTAAVKMRACQRNQSNVGRIAAHCNSLNIIRAHVGLVPSADTLYLDYLPPHKRPDARMLVTANGPLKMSDDPSKRERFNHERTQTTGSVPTATLSGWARTARPTVHTHHTHHTPNTTPLAPRASDTKARSRWVGDDGSNLLAHSILSHMSPQAGGGGAETPAARHAFQRSHAVQEIDLLANEVIEEFAHTCNTAPRVWSRRTGVCMQAHAGAHTDADYTDAIRENSASETEQDALEKERASERESELQSERDLRPPPVLRAEPALPGWLVQNYQN